MKDDVDARFEIKRGGLSSTEDPASCVIQGEGRVVRELLCRPHLRETDVDGSRVQHAALLAPLAAGRLGRRVPRRRQQPWQRDVLQLLGA
jgi:hypothetical protein